MRTRLRIVDTARGAVAFLLFLLPKPSVEAEQRQQMVPRATRSTVGFQLLDSQGTMARHQRSRGGHSSELSLLVCLLTRFLSRQCHSRAASRQAVTRPTLSRPILCLIRSEGKGQRKSMLETEHSPTLLGPHGNRGANCPRRRPALRNFRYIAKRPRTEIDRRCCHPAAVSAEGRPNDSPRSLVWSCNLSR
jgi:hypothetical protein